MRLLITGATGLVGHALIEKLMLNGYEDIHILTRNPAEALKDIPFPIKAFSWNPNKNEIDLNCFEQVQCILHLAGENLTAARWTQTQKDKILNSRAKGTQLLINSIRNLNIKPEKFICASAVGIYGNRGEEQVSTDSSHGTDFLAEVCKTWEAIALNHNISEMKTLCVRIGVVLSRQGGALAKMLPGFKSGFAGPLGDGQQYLSWIHIEDLVNLFLFCIKNPIAKNIINAVSPEPVTNKTFTKLLAKAIGTTAIIPVPGFLLKAGLGEMSQVLLGGQKVVANNLGEMGFQFHFHTLEETLRDLLKFDRKKETQLLRYQFINQPLEQVFEFFSHEKNLERITPPHLNFTVLNKTTAKIQKGTVIHYQLKLHGLPLKWSSLIMDYQPNKYFIDKQIKGPYNKWVHTHSFFPLKGGTLIKDEVHYKLPMGAFGRIFAGPFVRKDVSSIFSYRQKVISTVF